MIKITFDNGEEYTEEQYKRDYVRMMDYLSEDRLGEKNCQGVDCADCPLLKETCRNQGEENSDYRCLETVKIVHDWAKDHPIYTNRDKLKKVFGINVTESIIVDCEKREARHAYYFSNIKDKSIPFDPISQEETFGDWLDEEYKGPKGEKKNG